MIVSAKGIYINFLMIIPFAALVRSATSALNIEREVIEKLFAVTGIITAAEVSIKIYAMVLWARHSQILETYYQITL